MDAQTVTRPHPLNVDDIPCTVDDIPWRRLAPIPRPEDRDLLALSDSEVWTYLLDLLADNRALRVTLHRSLDEIVCLTTRLRASTQTVIDLREQIRTFTAAEPPSS